MLKEHHTYFFARPLALYYNQRSWPIQLGIAWISLLCLVSMLARLSIGSAGLPFSADSHAGTLFVLALVVYHLLFDAAATLGVLAFTLLARLLLGPTYGQVYLG